MSTGLVWRQHKTLFLADGERGQYCIEDQSSGLTRSRFPLSYRAATDHAWHTLALPHRLADAKEYAQTFENETLGA